MKKLNLCSIINVKSGKCSENCSFCSQSGHYKTDIQSYDILDSDTVIKAARKMESYGAERFSLVSSGKALSSDTLTKLIPIYKRLKAETNLKICASHGLLDIEKAKILKESGVTRYHHNLETSREYFDKICTTHKFQDRIDTIINAKQAGMEVCSGGIFGIGETVDDRISMAKELKKLEIKSIPVNFLVPIKGTPMESAEKLTEDEILELISIFKKYNPDADIILAGGRTHIQNRLKEALEAGINSLMIGDYLTTQGEEIKKDLEVINSSL